MEETSKIQKLIANSGYASRRKAEELIIEGRVSVNGKIAKIGERATKKDVIKIDGVTISLDIQNFQYFLLNKPKNTISTANDPFNRTTVVELIQTKKRIVPVGRLDYDTTGVLLLTNDLELVNKLTHPKYEIKRIYEAELDSKLSENDLKKLNKGITVNGKISNQTVKEIGKNKYSVSLHVGSYHHVKKLFGAVGRGVLGLKRVSFAGITAKDIPEGKYRELTPKEIKALKLLVESKEKKLWKNQK